MIEQIQREKPIYEEIINEIGTQTLARFGLNIFSLNTYAAYGASVSATNATTRTYHQHKNNGKAYGYFFEEIDKGQRNITDSLFNTSVKTYRTDELADIKKTQEIMKSGKKLQNLTADDRERVEYVLREFPDEVKNMDFNSKALKDFATKNHQTTDLVKLDSSGNVVWTSQHKVIKNTNDLLQDKYLENNDSLTMPFDDYKRHREELERKIASERTEIETKEKAKRALEMLNKNNITNRLMCENPRATAVITQTTIASGHVMQAGMSDAIVVALCTLANGVIWEIKDMIEGNTQTDFSERIRRLFNKVIESCKSTFARGASFGIIDIAVGLLTQIFKSVAGKIKTIWTNARNSAKSIFNALYSFMRGEITHYSQLLTTIIQAIFSAGVVVASVALETKLEAILSPIITPLLASFVAPALSIVVGSLAIVYGMKQIEVCINVFYKAIQAKQSYEELEKFYDTHFPLLIEQREILELRIQNTHRERMQMLDCNFTNYQAYLKSCNYDKAFKELNKTNELFGFSIQKTTTQDLKNILSNNAGILKWE